MDVLKTNIKKEEEEETNGNENENNSNSAGLISTPMYNNGIVEDMLFVDHLKLIHKYATLAGDNFVEATLLIKVTIIVESI